MKMITKITIALLFAFMGMGSMTEVNAQFLDKKGFVVGAYSYDYIDAGETVTTKCDQAYSISLTDKMLCHTIYVDGYIDQSQLYQLSNIEKFMDGENTIIKITATSGMTGKTYDYKLSIGADGKLIALSLTDKDGAINYHGDLLEMKTFVQ